MAGHSGAWLLPLVARYDYRQQCPALSAEASNMYAWSLMRNFHFTGILPVYILIVCRDDDSVVSTNNAILLAN